MHVFIMLISTNTGILLFWLYQEQVLLSLGSYFVAYQTSLSIIYVNQNSSKSSSSPARRVEGAHVSSYHTDDVGCFLCHSFKDSRFNKSLLIFVYCVILGSEIY